MTASWWWISPGRWSATSGSRSPEARHDQAPGNRSRCSPSKALERPPALGPRVGRRGGLELRAPLVPGTELPALAGLELLVLARNDLRSALPPPDPLRHPADVPPHPLGGAGVPVGEGHRVRG